MNAKEFWKKVDDVLEEQNITITELALLIGKSRNTLFSQRKYPNLPKADQIRKMEDVLKCKFFDEDDSCLEFLPYLRKAEEWQLRSVRQILNMPEPFSKSDGGSTSAAN